MTWIYFWLSCGIFSCTAEQHVSVTEAQCRELVSLERTLTRANGDVIYSEACLTPDGKWIPGRIGFPVVPEAKK